MANLTWTIANGTDARTSIRTLAKRLNELVQEMPGGIVTGGATTLTISNAPATGTLSVVFATGPHSGTVTRTIVA